MAQRQKQAKALQLYLQGKTPPEIAKEIDAPLRSVQRWIKTYREGRHQDPAESENENYRKAAATQTMGADAGQKSQKWLDSVELCLDRRGSIDSRIATLIEQKLQDELQKPDYSVKAVNTLSLALTRHLDGEMRASLMGREKLIET